MFVYTAPAFRASKAGAGTDQSKSRPVTFTGNGETVKVTLTDAQYAAWSAEPNADKRAAILAQGKSRPVKTGKVQVTTAALALWQARVIAECDALNVAAVESLPEKERDAFEPRTYAEHAAAILSSGVIVLDNAAEDDTEDTLAALFG